MVESYSFMTLLDSFKEPFLHTTTRVLSLESAQCQYQVSEAKMLISVAFGIEVKLSVRDKRAEWHIFISRLSTFLHNKWLIFKTMNEF